MSGHERWDRATAADGRHRNGQTHPWSRPLFATMVVVLLGAVMVGAEQSVLFHSTSVNLHSLRMQIERYKIDHGGMCPTLSNHDLQQLTANTDARGVVGPPGDAFPFGPYFFDAIPPNPADGSSAVTAVAVPGQSPVHCVGERGGWQYDPTTGTVWPNHSGWKPGKD